MVTGKPTNIFIIIQIIFLILEKTKQNKSSSVGEPRLI